MDTNFVNNILWEVFKNTWWLWLSLLIIYILLQVFPDILKNKRKRKKYQRISEIHSDKDLLNKLKSLNFKEFEEYISYLFSKLGYKTEVVGKSHDGGVDVIAEKEGIKHYIQCKKFNNYKVSLHDVRDFYGAMTDFLSESKGYFVTTNVFTLEAEKFVQDKPIELVDGGKLIKYIKMADIDNENYFKDR